MGVFGASSGVTTGEIVSVGGNYFQVRGHELTPFSIPGDSGSLVLDVDGVVLGVIASIVLTQYDGVYASEVLPIWEFFERIREI